MRPEKDGRVMDDERKMEPAWLPSDDAFCLKAVQLL